MRRQGRLLQFAKWPQAGRVKTRMQPALSDEQCLQLHHWLTITVQQQLHDSRIAPVELWLTEQPTVPIAQDKLWWYQAEAGAQCQRGKNLGERMQYALNHALQQNDWAIVVGSDCPFLSQEYLHRAAASLRNGADAVIGPAHDGGYVLLGISRCAVPALFEGVEWGSDQVMAQTLSQLEQLGWQYELLPVQSDIDRPTDLPLLRDFEACPLPTALLHADDASSTNLTDAETAPHK